MSTPRTRRTQATIIADANKAEIKAIKTNSFVERVMVKLKEGPEAHIQKYAKDVVKFHKDQVTLANAEIEKLETYLEEKEEEIQELAESIDLSAIKNLDTRTAFIERRAVALNAKFVELDTIKAKIEATTKQIANHNRLLAVYA